MSKEFRDNKKETSALGEFLTSHNKVCDPISLDKSEPTVESQEGCSEKEDETGGVILKQSGVVPADIAVTETTGAIDAESGAPAADMAADKVKTPEDPVAKIYNITEDKLVQDEKSIDQKGTSEFCQDSSLGNSEGNEEDVHALKKTSAVTVKDLQEMLYVVLSSEEFSNHVKTQSKLEETLGSLREIILTVRKGAFEFQTFTAEYNDLINQSGWTKKDFDIIGLYQNPAESEIAKDWFDSITRAVDLVNKALNGETDEKLGRIPPRTFRACLKMTSRFDPVTTLSTLTPMYSLRKTLPEVTISDAIQRCIAGLYSYAKWILSTEKKITTELLKVLKLEDYIAEVENELHFSIGVHLSRLHDKLSVYETSEIQSEMSDNPISDDDMELIQTAKESLIEGSRELYNMGEEFTATISSLTKSFFKGALSDLYKLFNDLCKTIDRFNADTREIKDSEDKESWNELLLKIKNRIEAFLGTLTVYKNPDVFENTTVWNDTMDYVEIIDAEDDDTHEHGMISQVHNIGFYIANRNGQKDYIEKTKVSVYRNSQN